MARPTKNRRICCMPQHRLFGPANSEGQRVINLAIEEYETIRLIDLLGCTQDECAEQMAVGRTTVQSIYNHARQKLAEALVNGCQIAISGGAYEVCETRDSCACASCNKRDCRKNKDCQQKSCCCKPKNSL